MIRFCKTTSRFAAVLMTNFKNNFMITKRLFFKTLFFLLFILGNEFSSQVNLSLDTGFNSGGPFFNSTTSDRAVVLPDDKILLMGRFQSYNGTSTNSLARLNADGTLDKTFVLSNITNVNYINSPIIKVLKNGKIVIGGGAGMVGAKGALVRLNSDGSPDSTFLSANMLSNEYVTSIDELENGKIVVGGTFTSFNGVSTKGVVILNEDGTLDNTFNISSLIPTGTLNDYIVFALPGNKVLVNGYFMVGGVKTAKIYKFNVDGTMDTQFNSTNGTIQVNFSMRTDGKILFTGSALYSGVARHGLHLMDQNGTLDPAFNASGSGFTNYATGLKQLSNGQILLTGLFTAYNNVARNRIALINADGSLDTSFDPLAGFNISSSDMVLTADVQSDNKIIVAGHFTKYNNDLANSIARINTDGKIDNTFNAGNIGVKNLGTVNTVIQLSDGKYAVGGGYAMLDGKESLYMSKLNSDGTIDTTFKSNFNNTVNGILELADGKLMVGGAFNNYGTSDFIQRLVILNADGTLSSQVKPSANYEVTTVNSLAKDTDGKILLGADLIGVGYPTPATKYGLSRLNADGSLDTTFNTSGAGFNSYALVQKIYFQADGKIILIGNNLTSYNGVAVNGIVRLNTNGTLDTSFKVNTGTPISLRSASILPSGKILIIGSFTSYLGVNRPGIALLNSDGSVDESFNPTYSGGYPFTAQALSDGSILFSGASVPFSGTTITGGVARIFVDGTADSSFNIGNTGAGGGYIYNFYQQADGKLLGYGLFKSYNGITRNYLARFDINGLSVLKTQEVNHHKTLIYPNPAKDFVTISNLKKGQEIVIYDVTGKLLYRTTATQTVMTLNTTFYKNGLYLVKIGNESMKLMISK